MADTAIADFDARINLFDSAFPVRRVHSRGGLPRHVPGRDHQRPIVPRSQELLSRERKATMGRWCALRILPCLLEVLSRERKATMGRWHSSMIVPWSLRRSDSRVWWAEIGRNAAGALRHKMWAVLSLRSDDVNSAPAEESGDSRSLPGIAKWHKRRPKAAILCHFLPVVGNAETTPNSPSRAWVLAVINMPTCVRSHRRQATLFFSSLGEFAVLRNSSVMGRVTLSGR
jgi:hypothetical protein